MELDEGHVARGGSPVRYHERHDASHPGAPHDGGGREVAARAPEARVSPAEEGSSVGLAFRPLAREAYGLLIRAKDLGDRSVVRVCEVAQSERFRNEVAAIPGYDPTGAGDIKYDGA